MQAIILAAGNGSRLQPLTNNISKVMIEVCGESIIKRALKHLGESKKITEVIIVVGYQADKLIEHIGDSFMDMKIKYVRNKDYSTTNNIYSLWLAKNYINNDVILVEGDVIFEKEMIMPLLHTNLPNLVLVAKYNSAIPGTVITTCENNVISSFIGSKEQEEQDNYFVDKCKTINLYSFNKRFFEKEFMPRVENHMKTHGKNDYYEVVLGSLVSSGVEMHAHLIEDIKWYEIDNKTDLEKASVMFS